MRVSEWSSASSERIVVPAVARIAVTSVATLPTMPKRMGADPPGATSPTTAPVALARCWCVAKLLSARCFAMALTSNGVVASSGVNDGDDVRAFDGIRRRVGGAASPRFMDGEGGIIPKAPAGVSGRIRSAAAAQERAENDQRLLHELHAAGLYAMNDGQVRMAKTEAERLEMQGKLLEAGHALDAAKCELQRLLEDGIAQHSRSQRFDVHSNMSAIAQTTTSAKSAISTMMLEGGLGDGVSSKS